MSELLLKVDPACLQANEQAGHVVAVQEDGFSWSELERKLFVVVRVPLTVAEAKAKYLKSGIPDDLFPKTIEELDYEKLPKSDDYPSRANYFDMTKVPQAALDVVSIARQTLTDCEADAKQSARDAVEALSVVSQLNVDIDAVQSLKTSQLAQVVERELGDEAVDAVRAASKDGRDTIEKPLLAAIEAHPIIDIDDTL